MVEELKNWKAALFPLVVFLTFTGQMAAPAGDKGGGGCATVRQPDPAQQGVSSTKQASPASFFGAAARGDAASVELFLSQGIDVNSRNPNGATALQLASAAGYLPVVQSLIANGADVNAADRNGTNPLMAAAQGGFDDVVKALKSAGARGAASAQQPAASGSDDAWWKK